MSGIESRRLDRLSEAMMDITHQSEAWTFRGEWHSEHDAATVAKLWQITPMDDERARPRYEAAVYHGGTRIDTVRADTLDDLTVALMQLKRGD